MEPQALEYIDQKFTVYITDSSEQELKLNGRNTPLTCRNKEEYLSLAK